MSNSTLYIPSKIKVGLQNRDDTYTKQLGYVIYQDEKGKWRKEGSWEGWRDKKIDPKFFDNEPTTGFVLNKGVTRYETNRSMIRIYDPRGFEFEITVANLLFLLTETDCGRKGIEGEMVYAWEGKDLILLPVSSFEYKESKKYTELVGKKISARDLKVGHVYADKYSKNYTYLGRFKYWETSTKSFQNPAYTKWYEQYRYSWSYQNNNNIAGRPIQWEDYSIVYSGSNKHIFMTDNGTIVVPTTASLKIEVSATPVENIAELIQKFTESEYAAGPEKVIFEELDDLHINTYSYDRNYIDETTLITYYRNHYQPHFQSYYSFEKIEVVGNSVIFHKRQYVGNKHNHTNPIALKKIMIVHTNGAKSTGRF